MGKNKEHFWSPEYWLGSTALRRDVKYNWHPRPDLIKQTNNCNFGLFEENFFLCKKKLLFSIFGRQTKVCTRFGNKIFFGKKKKFFGKKNWVKQDEREKKRITINHSVALLIRLWGNRPFHFWWIYTFRTAVTWFP